LIHPPTGPPGRWIRRGAPGRRRPPVGGIIAVPGRCACLAKTIITICALLALAYAQSIPAVAQHQALVPWLSASWLKIALLLLSLIAAPFIARASSRARAVTLAVIMLLFVASQARSFVAAYTNTILYQRRHAMALSDLEILELHYDGRLFGGRRVLPLLIADHIPRAKVFLYDDEVYRKPFLAWSGRDPDSTFIIGGYQSTVSPAFKAACMRRPHVVHDDLYIALPLSIYENEAEVFLMKDAMMNYLIPGSWRNQHE
jgi:hypothetical protein